MRLHPFLGVVLLIESAVFAGAGLGELVAGRAGIGVMYIAAAVIVGRVGLRWTGRIVADGDRG